MLRFPILSYTGFLWFLHWLVRLRVSVRVGNTKEGKIFGDRKEKTVALFLNYLRFPIGLFFTPQTRANLVHEPGEPRFRLPPRYCQLI